MPIRFDHPEYLWLLLLALPVVWLGRRSLASLETSRRWTAIGLRLALMTVIILMLSGLQAVRWHRDLTVIAVVDESESVRRFVPPEVATGTAEARTIGDRVRDWLSQNAQERRPDDRFGLVTFDARPTVRVMPSPDIDVHGATLEQPMSGTDTANGVRQGLAAFPSDTARRMILIGDGNDTTTNGHGDDLLATAREAAAAGVPIDVVPIEYAVKNEVMVDGVYAPSDAREGQAVALRVVLRSTRPAAGTLNVLLDGEPIALKPEQSRVTPADWSDGNVLVRRVEAPALKTGANRFVVVFEPAEGDDAMPSNNRLETFTLVQGKGRVLVVDGVSGESGMILPNVLKARGIEAEVVDRNGVPISVADMQRYDAIIFQNLPAEDVPPSQQKMLETYVNELGGGFVMIGGPDSFGAGGWTNTPVDEMLPVTCSIPEQSNNPVGALVMVIDESGSMESGMGASPLKKQQVANRSAMLAARTLFPTDLLGVLAFSDHGRWVYPLAPYANRGEVDKLIDTIGGGGGTIIYAPLAQAYDALANRYDRNIVIKHILMLTDGQGTGGDYDTLLKKMNQSHITLSTVGVGDSIDKPLLERLAKEGQGSFYQIIDPKDLPQIFIKEARQVRKQLIREKPFQPQIRRTASPIVSGIAATPYLGGMVLTGARRNPRVFMPLVGPEQEPVFAHWQVGLGRTAAFTSDAHNRWAADWLSWDGYADFWTRTIRTIARPAANRNYDLLVSMDRETLRMKLDTGSANAGMKIAGTVLTPGGEAKSVALQAVSPGVFEATMPAAEQGSYIVSLFAGDGEDRGYVFGGVTRQPGQELRLFESNRALLEQVAQITGGRVLSLDKVDPAALYQRDGTLTASRSIRPVWRVLLWIAIGLFMLDVASRRVAWDFGAIVARFRRAQAASKARASEAHAAAEAIRRKAAEAAAVDPKAEVKSTTTKTARFEPPAESRTPREKVQPAPKTASTPTTNRLLDAKRRAQQRLNQDDNDG